MSYKCPFEIQIHKILENDNFMTFLELGPQDGQLAIKNELK